VRFLVFAPTQRIGALVINSCPIAFIHLAIGLQRAVVDFVISLNMEHADKAAPFELHDAPRLTDLHFADRMQSPRAQDSLCGYSAGASATSSRKSESVSGAQGRSTSYQRLRRQAHSLSGAPL